MWFLFDFLLFLFNIISKFNEVIHLHNRVLALVAVYETATEWSKEWVFFDTYVDRLLNIKLRSQLQQELGHADLFVLETVDLHGAVAGAVGV